MANQPTFRAYTVIDRGPDTDPFWLPIGAAFAHSGGTDAGLNVILNALPIPDKDGQCKIVLRPPKGDEQTTDTGPRVIAGTDREKASQKRR